MRSGLIACLAALALVAPAGDAAAYPQFQLSTGNDRCSSCHVSPSGGGMLTDYGRSEAGDTISRGGDGAFAHGAWTPPDWLQLSADFRGALGSKQLDGEDPTLLAFPMLADIRGRIIVGPISLNLTVGLNGAARERPDGANPLNYLASREHYLMYQREAEGLTIRAGRFFPTIGVRSQDHTSYPRRHLDQYLLEEPYTFEVSVPIGAWEAFASGFMPNPIPLTGAGNQAAGGTAFVERMLGSTAAVAGQARVAIGSDERRYLVGAVGKWWIERAQLMVLSELDIQRQQVTAGPGFVRWQLMGYLGVTRMILPGYMIGAAIQRWAPDVTFGGTTRNAVELNIQWFPWAHVEAHLLTRVEATGGDTTHPNLLALLQLHYYL